MIHPGPLGTPKKYSRVITGILESGFTYLFASYSGNTVLDYRCATQNKNGMFSDFQVHMKKNRDHQPTSVHFQGSFDTRLSMPPNKRLLVNLKVRQNIKFN